MTGPDRRGRTGRRLLLAALVLVALPAVSIEGEAQRPERAALQGARHRDPYLIPARRAVPAPQDDRWFGEDKARHLGASAAIQIMGFGVLRSARVGQRPSLVAAGAASLAAGVGKELADRRGGGDPSLRDLAWDVAGIALGSVVAVAADVR